MKQEIAIGQTDKTVLVFIPDPASTDGSGKTGLAAADLTVSYTRVETDNDVVVTDVTSSLGDIALTDAHTDWGVEEVSNTLAPGLYRLDLADAVFASGATEAVVYVMITTSAAAASPMEFTLYTPAGDVYSIVNDASIGNANIKALIDDAIGYLAGFDGAGVLIKLNGIAIDSYQSGAHPLNLVRTTIQSLASQTSFTLAAGSANNDAYPAGSLVIVTDSATATQKCVGVLSDYVGATRTVTLGSDPGVFTMANGDTVNIMAASTVAGLDAAGVRAAVGLASANLDTQLSTIDTVVDAVKAKTDQLTFTVANQVDANTESMNAAEVLGNGTSGNKWRG